MMIPCGHHAQPTTQGNAAQDIEHLVSARQQRRRTDIHQQTEGKGMATEVLMEPAKPAGKRRKTVDMLQAESNEDLPESAIRKRGPNVDMQI